MADLLSAGTVYQTTCLRLPAELKAEARAAGINLSRTLKEALEEKLYGSVDRAEDVKA